MGHASSINTFGPLEGGRQVQRYKVKIFTGAAKPPARADYMYRFDTLILAPKKSQIIIKELSIIAETRVVVMVFIN